MARLVHALHIRPDRSGVLAGLPPHAALPIPEARGAVCSGAEGNQVVECAAHIFELGECDP